MTTKNRFGALLKKYRMATGATLREFCKVHGFDAGNHSKLERGLFGPPTDRDRLVKYAMALGLSEGSDGWMQFFDVASAEKGEIPEDLMSDDEVVEKLPAFFRTVRATQISPEKLDDLVDRIKRS